MSANRHSYEPHKGKSMYTNKEKEVVPLYTVPYGTPDLTCASDEDFPLNTIRASGFEWF